MLEKHKRRSKAELGHGAGVPPKVKERESRTRESAPRQLPSEGFVRLSALLAPVGPIPVSRSSWWAGVKAGRYPQPKRLGPKITVWDVADIRALIARGAM